MPDEIVTLFAKAIEGFEPIVGQLGNVDLQFLQEIIFGLFLQIPYDKEEGKHNLVGLLMKADKYHKIYGFGFVRPKR